MRAYTSIQIEKAAACIVKDDRGEPTRSTVLDYLYMLFRTLWREGENFNGKRPFGNSAWQYPVYAALIREGFIKGELDEDGCVKDMDIEEADDLVGEIINRLHL
mgnify:CR=1 FL=1